MVFHNLEISLVFAILFLLLHVESQIIFPYGTNICAVNSYCVHLERCPTLRNQQYRDVHFTYCDSPRRRIRRVCCPRSQSERISSTAQEPTRVIWRPSTFRSEMENPATHTFTAPSSMVSDCGKSNVANFRSAYVIGGRTAMEGAWPWMVALTSWERRVQDYTPFCTGFLIDRKHVLTAAHCFHDKNLNLYRARIGKVKWTEGNVYKLIRIVLHERYRKGYYYNDIAILTLDRSVSFPGFNPVCLPDGEINRMNISGIGTTVAGWGKTERRGKMSLTLQQLSEMPVMLHQDCNKIYRDVMTARNFQLDFPEGIDSNFICAGFPKGRNDSCGGDSGGPLMLVHNDRWYAIGIVSFGMSCGRPGIPGGYTKVSSYLHWIRENTRD